jgi:hypothetical protein
MVWKSRNVGDDSVSSDLHATTSVATRCHLPVMRDGIDDDNHMCAQQLAVNIEDVLSVALKVYLAWTENRVRLPVAWRVFHAEKRGELTAK